MIMLVSSGDRTKNSGPNGSPSRRGLEADHGSGNKPNVRHWLSTASNSKFYTFIKLDFFTIFHLESKEM